MFPGNLRLLLVCKMKINHAVWLTALRKSFFSRKKFRFNPCVSLRSNCEASVRPVIATQLREKTPTDDTKLFTMFQSVTVFLHFRLQLQCKCVLLFCVIASCWRTSRTICLVLPYFLNLARHTHERKSSVANPIC